MRLIDLDALGIGKCNPDVFNDKGYAKGWNSAIEILQNASTVDAVPVVRVQNLTEPEDPLAFMDDIAKEMNDIVKVVRCKDCKHCFVDGDNVRFNVCELNHNRVQADDWYCADGERKGGDE